jgi:hypothetical protein
MKRHLLTPSLSNPRKNAETILKTRVLFIHEEVHALCKNMRTAAAAAAAAAQRRIAGDSLFF